VIAKQLRYLGSIVFFAFLVLAVGCGKKKTEPPPPPPPPVLAPEPTAEITATPAVVTAGDKVVLAWRTTNATEVMIEGLGTVSAEGTQTVNPLNSTNYHLVAKSGTATADATARVTVNTPPPPPPSAPTSSDIVDEASFRQKSSSTTTATSSAQTPSPSFPRTQASSWRIQLSGSSLVDIATSVVPLNTTSRWAKIAPMPPNRHS
jgi:hypothetical protein